MTEEIHLVHMPLKTVEAYDAPSDSIMTMAHLGYITQPPSGLRRGTEGNCTENHTDSTLKNQLASNTSQIFSTSQNEVHIKHHSPPHLPRPDSLSGTNVSASAHIAYMTQPKTDTVPSRKPSPPLKNPPEQEVPSIVGGALDLAGGITSDAGADEVGDALSAAGDAVDGSDAKKPPHRVRTPKGDDKGDKKGAAGAATGGALELAGAITSAAGADKVGDALSAAGEAVDGGDAKKKPHRVRSPKGDKDGKKEAAAGSTGGALELAGAITSAAGADKVGDALSAAGGAVDGKKDGSGKAGGGKGRDGAH